MPHVHNALHHATRLQAAFKVAVHEADPGFNGIERAGETLTPVLDLWREPEWALLRGEILFARHIAEAALINQFSGIELVNPSTSGVLAVVRLIQLTFATDEVDLVIDSGASIALNPTTTQGVALDGRYAQLGATSACQLVTGDFNAGASLPQWKLRNNAATVAQETRCPWVLDPGRKLFLLTAAENQALQVNFFWTERIATDDELARLGS